MAKTARGAARVEQPADELATLSALKSDPRNPRQRNARGRDLIVKSLTDYGAARSIVIDEDNVVLAGNGVVEGAAVAGINAVRIIESNGREIVAVRRRGLSDQEKRALTVADNRTAELAEWNPDTVLALGAEGLDLRPFWTPEEQGELASHASAAAVLGMAEDGDEPRADEALPNDYAQFTCALTVEQERTVRAALRAARQHYGITTTGEALTAVLQAWLDATAQRELPA